MKVFAISDLHLSLKDGVLQSPQDRFGDRWKDHHKQISADWEKRVSPSDLVLVAGDLSWARRFQEAQEDLLWLDSLPGRKVIVKGNHDWWIPESVNKARAVLPASVSLVQHDTIVIEDILLFGTRLWSIPELDFPVDPGETGEDGMSKKDPDSDKALLAKEIGRLKRSIEAAGELVAKQPPLRKICMMHFPPTDFSGTQTEVTSLLSQFNTDICVFGHVHGLAPGPNGFIVDGVKYYLAACDYTGFSLLEIKCEDG
jgi:predicted phosphohydrolase